MKTATLPVADVLADPLGWVRGAVRPIGYVGLDIPEDILAAPQVAAVHLPWRHGQNTPWADRWLENSFAGWARSIVEDWAEGHFDFMDCVVFTRGDDTSQRLYYYLCELQRQGRIQGPKPVIFDTARIRRSTSEAWTMAAIRKLAVELGLGDDDLAAGIEVANRRRQVMDAIDADRRFESTFYEHVARASLFAPVELLVTSSAPADRSPGGRVLLAGSSPPDDSLHRAVESAGWLVAGEAYDRNLLRLGPIVDAGEREPFRRISEAALANKTGPRSFHDRSAEILAEVERRNIDAVVFWLYEEDEAIAWDVVDSKRALDANNIATLVMARRRWDLSDNPQAEILRFLGSRDA